MCKQEVVHNRSKHTGVFDVQAWISMLLTERKEDSRAGEALEGMSWHFTRMNKELRRHNTVRFERRTGNTMTCTKYSST